MSTIYKLITFTIFVLTVSFAGCGVFDSNNNKGTKIVPNNTPFIISTLEVTADTVHHYPEVYVARVTFKDQFYNNRLLGVLPGIWWPTLNAQVKGTIGSLDLVPTVVDKARVSITGPLGTENERTVPFKSEDFGVYGDQDYELELIERGRYRLDVTMPDDSRYRAFTTLPKMAQWPIPDTLRPELELYEREGHIYEQTPDAGRIRLYYERDPEAVLTVGKINQSDDRDLFSLEEDEGFIYEDRGNFLRGGTSYMIADHKKSKWVDSTFYGPVWFESEDDPLKTSEDVWMYLRQNNADMSDPWFYQNVYTFIGVADDGRWQEQDDELSRASADNDPEYLFNVSNILKVDENGNVLPKEQSDAVGVFGGFSSVYRKTVMKPRRSWDPDSLGWGPDNE